MAPDAVPSEDDTDTATINYSQTRPVIVHPPSHGLAVLRGAPGDERQGR